MTVSVDWPISHQQINLSFRLWTLWNIPSVAKRSWTRRTRPELHLQMMDLQWVSDLYWEGGGGGIQHALAQNLKHTHTFSLFVQVWHTFWSCWTNTWSSTPCTGSNRSEISTRRRWTLWWRSSTSTLPVRIKSCCKQWTWPRKDWISTFRYRLHVTLPPSLKFFCFFNGHISGHGVLYLHSICSPPAGVWATSLLLKQRPYFLQSGQDSSWGDSRKEG